MRDITQTARALRQARHAYRQFLAMHALETIAPQRDGAVALPESARYSADPCQPDHQPNSAAAEQTRRKWLHAGRLIDDLN